MASEKQKDIQWQKIGITVLTGLWNATKLVGKAVIWVAKKYWAWFESIGTDAIGSTPATVQQEVKVDTVLINGRPYYKDKAGRYRPMEV